MIDKEKSKVSKFFEILNNLEENNERHVKESARTLKKNLDGQDPSITSVLCSDSRVVQGKIWKNLEIGEEFSHENIGNQVMARTKNGRYEVSGSVDYIPLNTESPTLIMIVGHTGCGAIKAAYNFMKELLKSEKLEDPEDLPNKIEDDEISLNNFLPSEGIAEDIYKLIKFGLAKDYSQIKEREIEEMSIRNLLVERNVDNQVNFLKQNSSYKNTEIFGTVYDLEGEYGDNGELVLVNYNGENNKRKLERTFSKYDHIKVQRLDN